MATQQRCNACILTGEKCPNYMDMSSEETDMCIYEFLPEDQFLRDQGFRPWLRFRDNSQNTMGSDLQHTLKVAFLFSSRYVFTTEVDLHAVGRDWFYEVLTTACEDYFIRRRRFDSEFDIWHYNSNIINRYDACSACEVVTISVPYALHMELFGRLGSVSYYQYPDNYIIADALRGYPKPIYIKRAK